MYDYNYETVEKVKRNYRDRKRLAVVRRRETGMNEWSTGYV